MAYGRIDDNGRLIRYGSKVKIDGAWVDIESADAAEWRAENGVKEIIDDGGASCVCDEGEVPVATGWDNDGANIVRVYTATAITDANPRDIARAVKGADVSAMTGDQKDALLQKLVAALSLALMFAFPTFATVQTARLGDLTSDSAVVTNVEEGVTAETDPVWSEEKENYATMLYADTRATEEGVLGMNTAIEVSTNYTANALDDLKPRYSWNRPDAWAIDVAIDKAEIAGTATIGESGTDEAGRVFTNVTYTTTYQMAAQCSPRMLDESSVYFPIITSWAALPPGGSIDESGHFTATTSGLYRVSATADDGVTKYADIAISAERTVVTSNEYAYVDDDAAFLRHGCHTNALALLDAADTATTNTYGTTEYVVWNAYKPRFISTISGAGGVGAGNYRCFAVSAHILASASHYPDYVRRYNQQTFTDGVNSATVTKSVWHDLDAWAVQNGFTATEAAAVNDLALITCTGDAIPDSCRPYFLTPEAFARRFGSDAGMLTGWRITQLSDWAMPIVFKYANFTTWYAWGDTRRDLRKLITAMRFDTYPAHGGDSGLPIFLLDGTREIVVAHFTTPVGCRADYVAGFRIIKAFVEAHGESIKEAE